MIRILVVALQLLLVRGMSAAYDGLEYLYGTSSSPVKEYTGIRNRFMDATGPIVVEFYSPLCVSTNRKMENPKWKIENGKLILQMKKAE